MNLSQECGQHKLAVIALYAIAQENARAHGFTLDSSLKATCENAGVNRTQVYEKKNQIGAGFDKLELTERGRPTKELTANTDIVDFLSLKVTVLEYQLQHPGSVVIHDGGRAGYSDSFRRFILGLADHTSLEIGVFCNAVKLPIKTFQLWRRIDRHLPLQSNHNREVWDPVWPGTPNETAKTITADFQNWEGSTRDFLRHEAKKLTLPTNRIRQLLIITGMLKPKSRKYRYRDETTKLSPGAVIVTDGKKVNVDLEASGEKRSFNWQGTVDQATVCHTATVVSKEETAESVKTAYKNSQEFIGKSPLALVHDNKPIHNDRNLREIIEENTVMIPATPGRPENKASIEGEFGKFEQRVGNIRLDDSNKGALIHSAVSEVIRAYTAALDHTGRAEFDGKSRFEILRNACPDPKKDKKFVEEIASRHDNKGPKEPLPTQPIALRLLDYGFEKFGLNQEDPSGKLRFWLSSRFQPEAIRAALAIFGAKKEAGELKGQYQHRYLVKLIKSSQEEIDLRKQEDLLLEFAKGEKQFWLTDLNRTYSAITSEGLPDEELTLALAEYAACGGIVLERAYWEKHLINLLARHRQFIPSVCNHIRRLFEVSWNNRFYLINRLVSIKEDFAKV